MGIQIKSPNITASDDRQRLQQIQSYLYQMAQQLQWAFDTIETGGSGDSAGAVQTAQGKKAGGRSPAETFSDIKSLIIKSADIVNAYYDTISSRLEGLYVAQSDFGTYVEQTALELEANSKAITQNYTDIQKIFVDFTGIQGNVETLDDRVNSTNERVDGVQQDLNDLHTAIVQTNAYIKSGKIDEKNGIPIFGLEIGQTNSVNGQTTFDKFARFTADRLSFFDSSDVEVAYISDYHLHITNAVITGSLVLMQQFSVSQGNQSIDFKWLGG
jgi:hypothetical protein